MLIRCHYYVDDSAAEKYNLFSYINLSHIQIARDGQQTGI